MNTAQQQILEETARTLNDMRDSASREEQSAVLDSAWERYQAAGPVTSDVDFGVDVGYTQIALAIRATRATRAS